MKYLMYFIILIVVVAGAWLLLSNKAEAPSMEGDGGAVSNTMPAGDGTMVDEMLVGGDAMAPEEDGTMMDDGAMMGPVVVEVEGGPFYFNPSEIRVKQGQTVQINFTNKQGTHDWVLDEFNVRTPVTQAGQSATVTFVADKKGTFEYYCSVGDHRARGMVGKLVVE